MIKADWDDVQLVPFERCHVDIIVNYFHCIGEFAGCEDVVHSMLDMNKIPEPGVFRDVQIKKLEDNGGINQTIVIEYKGKPIGVHPLTHVTKGSAQMHAHIFYREFRKIGVGQISGLKALRHYFELYNFDEIILFPPIENKGALKLAVKAGFENLGILEIENTILKPGIKGNKFKVDREHFFKIYKDLVQIVK